jgi:hypothetical protein
MASEPNTKTKVSALKKILAPVAKGPLKAIPLPYTVGGSTYYQPGKSWARDVKSDEKGRRLLLNHIADADNPDGAQITENLKGFVERINEIIEQKLPDCDIRMELNELRLTVETFGSILSIASGEVIN